MIKRLIAASAIAALCHVGEAQSHTCADVRRAFDSGDMRRGLDLVIEAIMPYWRDGDNTPKLQRAVMFVCKNDLAVDLRTAGALAYSLEGRR